MIDLIEKVEKWAWDKGLHNADPHKQMLKVTEEVGEVAGALARNNTEELEKEIGDVIVTLIILSMQLNMSIPHCLDLAYNKIKHRSGTIVNGVFVKEEDLT